MRNILRKRGDTFPHKIQVLNKCTNEPLDVTGYTFLLTVDPSSAPTSAANNVMQLTGNVTDGPTGLVEFPLTPTDADNVGDYYYDIQMTDDGGKNRTIETGQWKMRQDITK